MSQKRIQDYGSPVVAQSLKNLTKSITPVSGVLEGFELIVDAIDRIRINPGIAVTHQGVIITEDEPKILNIDNTSVPVDYTIYYVHEDANVSGGVPAVLTLDSGLLTPAVVKGVILGYLRYPGGGVPLEQSFFIQPAPLKIGYVIPTRENISWLVPIKGDGYLVTITSGTTLHFSDTWDISGSVPAMYLKIQNNGLSTGAATLTFPFKVEESPFSLLQMIIATDINALVAPLFIDSAGTVTALTSTPFTGQTDFSLKSVEIPRTTVQIPNSIVYLQLSVSLAASRLAKIQALGLNKYNLPI